MHRWICFHTLNISQAATSENSQFQRRKSLSHGADTMTEILRNKHDANVCVNITQNTKIHIFQVFFPMIHDNKQYLDREEISLETETFFDFSPHCQNAMFEVFRTAKKISYVIV